MKLDRGVPDDQLTQKAERLEARLTAEQKGLLQQAAALEGTSLTDFVVRSACQAATAAVRYHSVLKLTSHESRDFVEALLSPPPPNVALQRAAEHYKQVMGIDD